MRSEKCRIRQLVAKNKWQIAASVSSNNNLLLVVIAFEFDFTSSLLINLPIRSYIEYKRLSNSTVSV